MTYSPLIQKAVTFAIKVHQLDAKQMRKGKAVPYITHPLTVGLIISRVTDDENTIIAGLLHDTIEDCKPRGSITKEMIAREFNQDVARMVDDVTEKAKELPWLERKLQALAHIKDMKADSVIVKSADVLHNMIELIQDIEQDGVSVYEKFNAPKSDVLTRYKKLVPEIKRVAPNNPLNSDLEKRLKQLERLSS